MTSNANASQKKNKGGRPRKGIVVALDSGNATSLLAFRPVKSPITVVQDRHGLSCTPSAVAFEDGDPEKIVFGKAALNLTKLQPEHVITYTKMLRGQTDTPVYADKNGRGWTAVELEAKFVQWLVQHFEAQTGERVVGILTTVPANFDDARRRATDEVIRLAGYEPAGNVNEPTAAGLTANEKALPGTYIIVDVGGGTTDVTIVNFDGNGKVVVNATEGRDVGGRDYTARLFDSSLDHMKSLGVVLDPADHLREFVRLQMACEDAKLDLSTQERAVIAWNAGGQMFDLEIAREKFANLTSDLSDGILELVQKCLSDASLQPGNVDGVVFAGGGSRCPLAREQVEALFPADHIRQDIDPEQAIVAGGVMAIGLKLEEKRAAGDLSIVNQVQQHYLKSDVSLQEVTAHDLGVRALSTARNEEVLAPIINANSPIPATASHTFGLKNGDKGTGSAPIVVLQGHASEGLDVARLLAEYPLENLPPGRVEDRIKVEFSLDSNGMVGVFVQDLESGKEIRKTVNTADTSP